MKLSVTVLLMAGMLFISGNSLYACYVDDVYEKIDEIIVPHSPGGEYSAENIPHCREREYAVIDGMRIPHSPISYSELNMTALVLMTGTAGFLVGEGALERHFSEFKTYLHSRGKIGSEESYNVIRGISCMLEMEKPSDMKTIYAFPIWSDEKMECSADLISNALGVLERDGEFMNFEKKLSSKHYLMSKLLYFK